MAVRGDGPRERLGDQVLGQVRTPGPGDHRPQAALVAGLVELGEARLVLSHISLTPQPPGTFTGPRRRTLQGLLTSPRRQESEVSIKPAGRVVLVVRPMPARRIPG